MNELLIAIAWRIGAVIVILGAFNLWLKAQK